MRVTIPAFSINGQPVQREVFDETARTALSKPGGTSTVLETLQIGEYKFNSDGTWTPSQDVAGLALVNDACIATSAVLDVRGTQNDYLRLLKLSAGLILPVKIRATANSVELANVFLPSSYPTANSIFGRGIGVVISISKSSPLSLTDEVTRNQPQPVFLNLRISEGETPELNVKMKMPNGRFISATAKYAQADCTR